MEHFKTLLRAAQQGDEAALSELDFDSSVELKFTIITITEDLLNTVYNVVSMCWIAAHLLHRDIERQLPLSP